MPFREKGEGIKGNIGIGFDLIDDCNIRCRQCFYSKSVQLVKMISLKQMTEIVKKVSGKFSEMYLLGGEPTLHPQLLEILKLGSAHFSTVILVTNGLRLADEEYCKEIALPGLNLSMHKRAASHRAVKLVENLSRCKGYFHQSKKAWENVEKFWQGDVNVQVNILKPLLEGGHLMDVFRWARERGYEPIIELTKPGPIFERGHELDVTSGAIQKLFMEMKKYDEKNLSDSGKVPLVLVPPSYGHNCTMIETGVHVYVDGNVAPCVAHGGIALGNIFTEDIEKILNSPIREAIKKYQDWIVGPCHECEYFAYCHGGCRGEAFWDTGCLRASDPYCWHIPKGLTLKDMVPISCNGCLLEDNPGCAIKV